MCSEHAIPANSWSSPLSKGANLAGRAAVVTGAVGDIGTAIAGGLLAAGVGVVVAGPSARARADVIATAAEQAARLVVCDDSHARPVVDTAVDSFGRLDLIVNVAGSVLNLPSEPLSPADIEWVYDNDVRKVVPLASAAISHLSRSPHGAVVNVIPHCTKAGVERVSVHAAMKLAMLSLTSSMSVQFADVGVRVNAVTVEPSQGEADAADLVWPVLVLAGGTARHLTGQVLATSRGLVSAR